MFIKRFFFPRTRIFTFSGFSSYWNSSILLIIFYIFFLFETRYLPRKKRNFNLILSEGCEIFQMLIRPLRLFLRKKKNIYIYISNGQQSWLQIKSRRINVSREKTKDGVSPSGQQSIDTLVVSLKVGRSLETLTAFSPAVDIFP